MDYLNKSRIEEVLIAILGKGMVTSRLLSRIEKILDAIRVKGSYDGIAMSEVEEILVCILLGKRFEKPTHSRIAAMLKVKANGGEYTELRKSRVEELIFEWINAVESATYIGTLPATLQTVKGYLESYKIYGNAVQDGTPTPENPIVPSGCGERTENLFDGAAAYGVMYRGGVITGQAADINKTKNKVTTDMIGKTYTISITPLRIVSRAFISITINGTTYWRENELTVNQKSSFKFTPVTENDHWYITYDVGGVCSYKDIMVNEGSTALPYIPYGYKLPILSNSTVTNIYLGEVETTRMIKKLVLTGEENWNKRSYGNTKHTFEYTFGSRIIKGLCSHYAGYLSANIDKVDGIYLSNTTTIIITDLRFTTPADFKAYLAAQYAAGTPVTVWYALAEPETAIVNEPLMKIGDYADTIDSTQTSVQIPTAAGTTVIDYNGTPKPDKVELTYSKPK